MPREVDARERQRERERGSGEGDSMLVTVRGARHFLDNGRSVRYVSVNRFTSVKSF
jgi:hypothetical protein